MRRMLGWTALVVVCCAAEAAAQDVRLLEAQAAFDEAVKLRSIDKYADALSPGERALALREAALGAMDPEVASCLHLVGDLYRLRGGLGDYARAEPLLQRGLSIREVVLGKDHPDVATSLMGLGNLYAEQGLYGQAEPVFRRALAIREAALGQSHPDVAQSLDYLAMVYMHQGLYQQAEPLFQRAVAIDGLPHAERDPDRNYPLADLARLYFTQGQYALAEPLYERALALRETVLGKHHPDVALSLLDLASLYSAQGLYRQAEPLYDRALALQEAALGRSHIEVIYSLVFAADMYMAQGVYGRAELLLRRAVAILEAAGLGKNQRLFANSLYRLGEVYATQGLYRRASHLHWRAFTVREAAFSRDHPGVARSLNRLAELYLNQHRLAEALPLFSRAFNFSEERLRREALGFSESRLESFLQILRADEERLYALLRAHPDDARVRHLALTAALLRKGRSVEEISNASRLISRSLGGRDREVFERLRGFRTQLAQLSLKGPGSLRPADYQRHLKELADQGDSIEMELAQRSAPLRALSALPPPGDIVDRVAASLPQDGALIELIAYADRPLGFRPGTPEAKVPSQLRYLAVVLFPDACTRALDLGPAAPIDDAASRLRDVLAERDTDYQAVAQSLYRLAFQPLQPLLGGVHRIFLAPDGQLGLVPFAALHDGRQFLIDMYDFIYLTSGKDLLPRPKGIPLARSVVVLADPEDEAPAAVQAPPSRALELAQLRSNLTNQSWAPLPGARREAEELQRLLPRAQLFLGGAASKERLLHLPTPGILHIATHGFFLEDTGSTSPGARGVVEFGELGNAGDLQPPSDPLLRSGLVLAGVDAPAKPGDTFAQRNRDHVLVTARELAGLDLWGTELVVLSACETGRGDVKRGQGVYGLRRALVVAGAETLVMSLWKVNDEATRTLMERYYRNLLAGKGRVAALNDAMRALREQQPHPHFWAPFIAMGSDAPLRGLGPVSPPSQEL